ncbi:MAG: type I restriction-modification system subunit M N-terminal domain-containing protein [Polyangiaceae bacterium]
MSARGRHGRRAALLPCQHPRYHQKLWNLCHILRDDGVTYLEYVTELTYLLFLKMAKETGAESQLPAGYRWGEISKRRRVGLLDFCKHLLVHLGSRRFGAGAVDLRGRGHLPPPAPQPAHARAVD